MSPVIRISEDVFRRLQRLSEPLVDTPSAVIDRVLACYEGNNRMERKTNDRRTQTPPFPSSEQRPTPSKADFSLFLVPATQPNLGVTIENGVSLVLARQHLPETEYINLRAALPGHREIHCWAINQTKKTVFDQMSIGDWVLITESGTGKFNYRGEIRHKLKSEPLAQKLWPTSNGKPWKYIYILDDVQLISIGKKRLVTALGYEPSFWVPGHIRVNPANLKQALEQYGSLDEVLSACRVP